MSRSLFWYRAPHSRFGIEILTRNGTGNWHTIPFTVMIQNYRISFNQAQRAINNNSHATTNQELFRNPKFIFWLALEGDLQTVGYSEWIWMNVWKTSQNSKLVDNLQQGISTGFQLFKNVESKIRQKSSKSGHNTPGNMTPSQVSPTHEPMSTDDSKSRGSHGTPTSPTKSMGSNKSVGTKEESYRHWFGIIFVKKFFSISNL